MALIVCPPVIRNASLSCVVYNSIKGKLTTDCDDELFTPQGRRRRLRPPAPSA